MDPQAIREAVAHLALPELSPDEPCRYSPAEAPHGERDGCDGMGHLFSPDGSFAGACPCFTESRKRGLVAGYMQAIDDAVVKTLGRADPTRLAIGAGTRLWWPGESPLTPGVIFSGVPDSGKTIAGHYFTIRLIEHLRQGAVYAPARKIGRYIRQRASPNPAESERAWERLAMLEDRIERGFIVHLDDLGRESPTDAVTQQMAEIISTIHEAKTPCVVSTNFDAVAVGLRYGKEIRSRMEEKGWLTPVKCVSEGDRLKGEN